MTTICKHGLIQGEIEGIEEIEEVEKCEFCKLLEEEEEITQDMLDTEESDRYDLETCHK